MDRVQKFYDDQAKLLVANTKPSKIIAEVGNLRTWLQKHQNEAIPDGAKGQLFAIMEKYNRASTYFTTIADSVEQLFTDYLQMPEGKLVSAGTKKKVLVWVQSLRSRTEVDAVPATDPAQEITSKWSLESLDEDKRSVSLLSAEDAELWREDVIIGDEALWTDIITAYKLSHSVIIHLNESNSNILRIEVSESS